MSVKLSEPLESVRQVDPIWAAMRREAQVVVAADASVASFVDAAILNQARLEDAVVHRVAQRLDNAVIRGEVIRLAFEEALAVQPEIGAMMRSDISAVYDRDPACERYMEAVLYFKGFHAIQAHRLSNWLWKQGRRDFALYMQSRISEVFQVDINPAAPVGRGVFFDHATGIVVGRTAEIGDNVSILQEVTLGGTGKENGDRHPKIRSGVLIGAGAKILGNIEIGEGSKVAAGSVVLHAVEPYTTVAGVPAKVVGRVERAAEAGRTMDQTFEDC